MKTKTSIQLSKILGVLIGFPIIATLISILLSSQPVISGIDLKSLNSFLDAYYLNYILIISWYLLQLYIISRILKDSNWSWSDIGIALSKKKMIYSIMGYLIIAFGLLIFIEMALAKSTINVEKLNSIPSFSPKTTTARVIFVFLALVAGIVEEIVYRGFAIKSLMSRKVNKWLAVLIASIPFIFQHGMRAIDSITGNGIWFGWYFAWGIIFGIIFLFSKKLYINIIIHWLVILSAMVGILQVIE
ncbi:CPBP family intramembrane glutamic endopeptidase [Maribacter ulvicola]|uniref:CAAX prenyl protease 2/Lysostaphin resistance protein A-like domain-containing protein n=1 Tax=Maribacter ulvicola TaxID=228959 RepID=A0A1N6UA23_9FLAO|nr:CPBP family intramembrane glutamic endopeptidase [Maribacter ulvicola]SIQ62443.1 hypothetical protein SAMN05421797_102265 [Maribacter ulvicola]